MTAWWERDPGPHSRGRPASTWANAAVNRARPRRGDQRPAAGPGPHGQAGGAPQGGDPWCSGAVARRLLHLARHGIEAELVPGITAALGCAASSFIPRTHRGLARSLTLVTGHLMDERDYQGWQGLTRAGHTLVFYMGLERAARIREGMLRAGLPGAAGGPGGGWLQPRQQVHEATLDGLEQAARALLGQSPVLIIMGEVQWLRAELQGC